MKAVWLVVAVSMSAWAGAGKRTFVLAAGDCADPGLLNGVRQFHEAASRVLGPELMDAEAVLDIVRRRASRSHDDLERQIDAAKALFYDGQADRAEVLLDSALTELDRASPETEPWALTRDALTLKALLTRSLNRPRESDQALLRIVRLEPDFQLDPEAFPPSALVALKAVKRALRHRSSLAIRVDSGPTAGVFVDGKRLGTTPLRLDLPVGAYRVALVADGSVSFPHRVELPKDTELGVDLAFEGGVSTQAPPCFSGASDAAAVRLGHLLAAEQVLVLHNGNKRGEPARFLGTLFELPNGGQMRSGAVEVARLDELAAFLLTGKPQLEADSKPVLGPTGSLPGPGGESTGTSRQLGPEVTRVLSQPLPRLWWLPLSGGVLIGAAGAITWGFANKDLMALSTGPTDGRRRYLAEDVDGLVWKGRLFEALGWAGFALGAAGVAAGVLMLALPLSPSQDAPKLSALATPAGAFVGLQGKW